jgi:hypothetical protein
MFRRLLSRIACSASSNSQRNQPLPDVNAEDVKRIVLRDFPSSEFDEVMSLLNAYGPQPFHREPIRVRIAALKLAGGNLEKLRSGFQVATIDYRDVLAAAGYPAYHMAYDRIRHLSKQEVNRIIEEDWDEYQQWLSKK